MIHAEILNAETFSGQQLILGLELSLVIAGAGYGGRSLSFSGAVGAVLIGTTIFGFLPAVPEGNRTPHPSLSHHHPLYPWLALDG